MGDSATPWTAARQASLSLTISQSLPKFISTASVMSYSHLMLWHSLLLPSMFPTIREFSNESAVCIRWPKYGSFIFMIRTSNKYSGLTSFKIYWFDLLTGQGTLRSLLQHICSWSLTYNELHLWHSGKEASCKCRRLRRHRFIPCIKKMYWKRTWQSTAVFLPGESHEQRRLGDNSPWDFRVRHEWAQALTYIVIVWSPAHNFLVFKSLKFPLIREIGLLEILWIFRS